MRIQTTQQALLAGLQQIEGLLPARDVIPVLTGIRIEANVEGVSLTAGKMDAMKRFYIPNDGVELDVHSNGAAVVPGKRLCGLIRHMPDGPILLEFDRHARLTIRGEFAEMMLQGMDPEQYPAFADEPAVGTVDIRTADLTRLIRRTAFAASNSEARPVLKGVLFQLGDEQLRLTATDGVRLADNRLVDDACHTELAIVVPARLLREVVDSKHDEPSTRMSVSSRTIQFATYRTLLQLPLIHGEYPAVDRILPQRHSTELTITRSRLLQAFERASMMADRTEHTVARLRIAPGEPAIVSACTHDVGESMESIPLTAMTGEAANVHVNADYMIGILRAIDSEHVRIRFDGPERPIVIQPADEPGTSVYVLTPVRQRSN